MKEILYSTCGLWGYIVLAVLTGVLISFAAELLNEATPAWFRKRYAVWLVAVVLSVVIILVFDNYYTNWKEIVLAGIANILIAWSFYRIAGKNFVPETMKKVAGFIGKKVEEG